jgi:hypothetical protein
MTIHEIPYQFHDALLEDFQVGPRREITLKISLYPIFYSGGPTVSVHFGGITNFDTVQAYFRKFEKPTPEIGFDRIDTLNYDTKYKSTENKLFFYLQLSGEGSLKIHCSNFTVSAVPNIALNPDSFAAG